MLAALRAALVFNDPITPSVALKLLQHEDDSVVQIASAICGLREIDSAIPILKHLFSRYERQKAAAKAVYPHDLGRLPASYFENLIEIPLAPEVPPPFPLEAEAIKPTDRSSEIDQGAAVDFPHRVPPAPPFPEEGEILDQ